MRGVLRRAADGLFPGGTNEHGLLPALLVLLTFVTGVVDAVSYLGLNHVFVANMTGNVVFLGFALVGGANLSAWASLLALGTFMAGAWSVGRLARRVPRAGRLFVLVTAAHTVLVVAALPVALPVALSVGHRSTAAQAVLIALLGCGMGLQNAVVRRLAVPDLTTTVLTLTVTGLAADAPGAATVRRVVSFAAMFTGALCGAALYLGAGTVAALVPVLVLLTAVTAAARS
ncbi:YoaK family protein [Streptomyces netropsis]|uniref:YoaK family protein n=1 Tax=Streptomyces netropsis TaxID=55404 RepID=UPI003795261F